MPVSTDNYDKKLIVCQEPNNHIILWYLEFESLEFI